ncbi:MAG: SUMF1/EgtB/PvdO family nonheme iron enzyme [Fibrobacterota bacterium]
MTVVRGLLFLLPLFLGCGYFDSALSPVESTTATLTGRVVDSLSLKGLPGVTVTLSALRDTSVVTGDNGLFNFSVTTTGKKRIRIQAPGYQSFERAVDLTARPNELDSLFLVRRNSRPHINRFIYPEPNTFNVPLTLKFKWSVSDSDFANRNSIEYLRYRFYLGTVDPPPLVDSGVLESDAFRIDDIYGNPYTFVINRPESLFNRLDSNRVYYRRLVVVDMLGDSDAVYNDVFRTRQAFPPCPDSMALVELKAFPAFCMDKYEFTNVDYLDVMPSWTWADRTIFSQQTTTPALNISKDSAVVACARQGKRLCSIDEWAVAVRGYDSTKYPYGPDYDPGRCNTEKTNAVDPFTPNVTWPVDSLKTCVSSYGLYDLSGNASEWVSPDYCVGDYPLLDSQGQTLYYHVGGAWWSRATSGLNSIASTTEKHLYDIGFRCCKNVH